MTTRSDLAGVCDAQPGTGFGDTADFERPFDAPPSPDELVQLAMRWHFGPRTGSPYWLRKARSLPFDPRTDVKSPADLLLFPDVAEEWRTVPVADLVPRGSLTGVRPPAVYESGGTTGPPKRIIDVTAFGRIAGWACHLLAQHADDGLGRASWLYLGPTGPHGIAQLVRLMADRWQAPCLTVDFDPRWVRRCLRLGRPDDARQYVAHLADQAVELLRSQPIAVLFATPPLLEEIAGRPALLDLLRSQLRAVLWAGTTMDPETMRLVREELLPGVALVGLYGNTLMGTAPQRPSQDGDSEPCVFQPHHPYTMLSVVDPATGAEVGYGETGQVRIHHLNRDFLLPQSLERDLAMRIAPVPAFPWDGVARVRPIGQWPAGVLEGVY
ncbi:AMP-binding protein [Kitasatospora sp. NPDC052896]|uniref:AMP-binding protein n=1 Tax=Kitasatospora sp. NPDC052896 TaxID=3364061 RepID=UPI0037C5A3A0